MRGAEVECGNATDVDDDGEEGLQQRVEAGVAPGVEDGVVADLPGRVRSIGDSATDKDPLLEHDEDIRSEG